MTHFLSTVTVATIGGVCKAFFKLGLISVTVNGLPNLSAALESDSRNNGRGVVTVSNHISTLDDPVTWGVLPATYFLSSRRTRWTLGASDIMFTNPILSTFFRNGQVLETFRGNGIYQASVDAAIQKLNQGDWIHLFGEGKVNQPNTYPRIDGIPRLPRFKWGVGRIFMESSVLPVFLPVWLTGFDKLMPEGRSFPYKYLPRLGTHVSVTFGQPLPAEQFQKAMGSLPADKVANFRKNPQGTVDADVERVRIEMTAIVHRAVESLGMSCSSSLSGGGDPIK